MSSSTTTPALAEIPAKSSAKGTPPQTIVGPTPTPAFSRPVTPPRSKNVWSTPVPETEGAPQSSVAKSPAPVEEIVDPAPFVGTRLSGPVPTIPAFSEPPFLSIATPPSTPAVPVTGTLTASLTEIVRRIEKGELKVTGYREGMSAEATLVAVLSALLTRDR
jgi:hypothetical protein